MLFTLSRVQNKNLKKISSKAISPPAKKPSYFPTDNAKNVTLLIYQYRKKRTYRSKSALFDNYSLYFIKLSPDTFFVF